MLRSLFFALMLIITAMPALAQEAGDLVGHWRVTAVDNPNDPWSADVTVTATDKPNLFRAVMVAEEVRGPDRNWQVEQSCEIIITGDRLTVLSKIVEILMTPDPALNRNYAPDHFSLKWRDADSLIGVRKDGYRDIVVVWTRFADGLV